MNLKQTLGMKSIQAAIIAPACPGCGSAMNMQRSKGKNHECGNCGKVWTAAIGPHPSSLVGGKAQKCPDCGSKKYSLMPTNFDRAKCAKCGNTWDTTGRSSMKAGGPGSGRHAGIHQELLKHGFEHMGNKVGYIPQAAIARKGMLSNYIHKETGDRASVHKNGNWSIMHSPQSGAHWSGGIGKDSLQKTMAEKNYSAPVTRSPGSLWLP